MLDEFVDAVALKRDPPSVDVLADVRLGTGEPVIWLVADHGDLDARNNCELPDGASAGEIVAFVEKQEVVVTGDRLSKPSGELGVRGATDVRISTAPTHYKDRPNIPHQHDKPDDVGVVARFRREDRPVDEGYAIACDR